MSHLMVVGGLKKQFPNFKWNISSEDQVEKLQSISTKHRQVYYLKIKMRAGVVMEDYRTEERWKKEFFKPA